MKAVGELEIFSLSIPLPILLGIEVPMLRRNTMGLLVVSIFHIFLISCSSLNKVECRELIDYKNTYSHIQKELKRLFPGYKEAWVSKAALKYSSGGERFFPVQVSTKQNNIYSILFHYSPENQMCTELSAQFVKLENIKNLEK